MLSSDSWLTRRVYEIVTHMGLAVAILTRIIYARYRADSLNVVSSGRLANDVLYSIVN